MSLALVAYGSSDDESETSDAEGETAVPGPGPAAASASATASASASARGSASESCASESVAPGLATASAATANACSNSPNSVTLNASKKERNLDSGEHFSQDEKTTSRNFEGENADFDISDEEDFAVSNAESFPAALPSNDVDVGPGPVKWSIISGLPAPKNAPIETFDLPVGAAPPSTRVRKQDVVVEEDPSPCLSALPAPKPNQSTTQPEYEDDVVEEIYKKKPEKAEVPVPKKRQPVKITVPSLAELDSDEEEDEPSKKKQKTSGGGLSGLLSLLPNPKHVSVKEAGRTLIPHTLTKRPVPKPAPPKPKPKPPAPSTLPKGKLLGIVDSDSDDEEGETVNFFSFGSDKPNTSDNVSNIEKESILPRTTPKIFTDVTPPVPEPVLKPDNHTGSMAAFLSEMKPSKKTPVSNSQDIHMSSGLTGLRGPYISGVDAPLEFKHDVTGEYYVPDSASTGAEGFSDQVSQPQDVGPFEPIGPEFSQDEQFQRMVGKKFRNEEICIMDVNADDQMSKEDLTKNITEEVSGFSYSKKKNKDMPSGMQKRKHQITYLAYQAKERELELKNQWAHNRQTKRQTQSKYGF